MRLEIGRFEVILRTTSPDLSDALRSVLGASLGLAELDGSVNFSVRVSAGPGRFHLLYWGRCVVFRTRDPLRLLDALDGHLALALPGEGLRVGAPALVRGSRAVLLAGSDYGRVAGVQRIAADRGWTLLPDPAPHIDASTGRLLVQRAQVLDADAVVDRWKPQVDVVEDRTEPGAYDIVQVLSRQDAGGPASRLMALMGERATGIDAVIQLRELLGGFAWRTVSGRERDVLRQLPT